LFKETLSQGAAVEVARHREQNGRLAWSTVEVARALALRQELEGTLNTMGRTARSFRSKFSGLPTRRVNLLISKAAGFSFALRNCYGAKSATMKAGG